MPRRVTHSGQKSEPSRRLIKEVHQQNRVEPSSIQPVVNMIEPYRRFSTVPSISN